MGPGRADQEWPTSPPRLVPQSDGYADYVDRSQPGPPAGPANRQPTGPQGATRKELGRGRERSRAAHAGHRKDRRGFAAPGRAARQRSIRSTITILLVIPLLSLIALWAYAAVSTVGGAIANKNDNTLNQEVGAPIAALSAALQTERADTFVWQSSHALDLSAHGHLPAKALGAMNASKAAMDAQRPRTNAALAAFEVAAKEAESLQPASDRPVAATLLADLNRLPQLRAEVDAGTIPALTAFENYTTTGNAIDPYAGGLSNPDGSIAEYSEAQAVLQEGEAVGDIAEEASLVGGVLAGGDVMSEAEHTVFVQTVDDQRLLEALGDSPNNWQESPNPYAPVDASPAFKNLQKLENAIVAGRPGALLPVSPTAWETGVGAVLAKLTGAEVATRLAVTSGQAQASDAVVRNVIVVGGAGLLAVIVSSVLLLGFGNRISRELTGLRRAARTMADERLPGVVGRLRAGGEVDVAVEAPPLDLGTRTREVTETADAFSAVQRTAVEAAVEQAQLRSGVSRVFRSLARRNQSLLQRQLKLLDEMERATEEPDALAQLFRLDHLTTRMRRQAEGLIILSGAAPGRTWRQPVPVVEVLRGAIGEIEDFARVELVTDSPDFVQGTAVADVTHMLAELIENAVQYSPPGTRVEVRGGRVANGYAIEIEDRGLGIPPDTMSTLNERLAKPPEFDLADSDQLGLFVVSRLAARHGVRISLRVSGYGGTAAVVLLPRALVVAESEVPFLAGRAAKEAREAEAAGRGTSAAPLAGASARPLAGPSGGAAAEALAGRRMLRPERGQNRASAGSPLVDASAANGPAGSADSGPAGLPRRAPQTNLAPQLRGSRPTAPTGGPLAGRSPEQARSLMSAIQQGLRSGRAAGTPDETDPGPGGEDAGSGSGWSQ
jgi:signal transduction histidine kinase